MMDLLWDACLDSAKLIPFLFVTYLLMEVLEHRASEKSRLMIEKAGKWGPVAGGALGVIPQCGFSTAASGLYAGRVITVGTLIAVYLSTSDEMLPILISESVAIGTILRILLAKLLIGIISGVGIDFVYHTVLKKSNDHVNIHPICEHDHCHCEDSVWLSAAKHTIKTVAFILIFTFGMNLILDAVGEERIGTMLTQTPVVGELLAGLVGLIPNCASSVIITELYLSGMIGSGAMISGLLVSAGVGLFVLIRMNRHRKENLVIIGVLYGMGVLWGVLIEALGIVF